MLCSGCLLFSRSGKQPGLLLYSLTAAVCLQRPYLLKQTRLLGLGLETASLEVAPVQNLRRGERFKAVAAARCRSADTSQSSAAALYSLGCVHAREYFIWEITTSRDAAALGKRSHKIKLWIYFWLGKEFQLPGVTRSFKLSGDRVD